MTTINKTVDRTVIYDAYGDWNILYSGFHRGHYELRVSSGGDRTIGSRPGYIRYLQGVNTKPYFRKGVLIRAGRSYDVWKYKPDPNYQPYNEVHNYTAEHWSLDSGSACAAYIGSGTSPISGGTAYNLLPRIHADMADTFSANDQIANLGKLRERIAGSSFNAGVALGEAPRALSMIGDTAKQIYSALKLVKRGKPVAAAKVLFGTNKLKTSPLPGKGVRAGRTAIHRDGKTIVVQDGQHAVASNWLALQYGWMPLVSDIYDGAVFIDHQLRNPVVHRVSATRYANGSMAGNYGDIYLTTTPAWIRKQHRQISSQRIVALLKEKDTIRLSGLTDPASVAWELLPYSFVVDWFIPIGNYLHAKALANALTGTFVTTRRRIITGTGKLPTAKAGWTMDSKLKYSGNQSTYVKIVRTVSTSLSIPLPEVKPLGQVASWAHALNGVALLTSLRK